MISLNSLKRMTARRGMRVGRGGKRGKTAGRGTKGQNARAGRKKRPEMRDMIKKIPKLRGYRFASFADTAVLVSLGILNKNFPKGGDITPRILVAKNIVKKQGGGYPRIKILGDGDIASKFVVSGCEVSLVAQEKIKKAGGSVKK